MCGIVGYIGSKQAQPVLLSGLKRLEYRGYDSAGMCVLLEHKKALSMRKLPGKVRALETLLLKKPLSGTLGIAHTRWATHGAPNQVNAHPHFDCDGEIAVVHNGIIENYAQLKSELIREGHKFKSQTDTEVIAHLIEKYYKNSSLEDAVRRAADEMVGSFALGVISSREPEKLVGARRGSPLVVGVGEKENFLASDIPALLDYTKRVIFLQEDEIAVLTKEGVRLCDLTGRLISREISTITWDVRQAQKQGFSHFMLKEINEQPLVLEAILKHRIIDSKIRFEELKLDSRRIAAVKSIVIVACGTAYHAGMVGKYILEELTHIPVYVDVSSEFRYRSPIIDKDSLVITISQSGETADTLAALRLAKFRGALTLGICNVLGSTLTRECDGVIYTLAGPEISVASTKAYVAQLATLYLLAIYLGQARQAISHYSASRLRGALNKIPKVMRGILSKQKSIQKIANNHAHLGSFLFLGRNVNYPTALEGALKLKEISYIPAEGYAAGEMKHGPIALIDEYRAVVCIAPNSKVYEKMISNIQEIRSRSGKIIVIASEEDDKIKELAGEVIYIPRTEEFFSPLTTVIPLQLIAYYIALKRGCDVDQPRNLAKSVTVE
jgi:glucosamine--fructose-6-phosphate aminotransferase (isomerizing)